MRRRDKESYEVDLDTRNVTTMQWMNVSRKIIIVASAQPILM